MDVVSRGNKGELTTRNAVAAAAYQAREALYDKRQQTLRDLEPDASDLVRAEILLPELAPYRWFDREVLWNEVEARERRTDAQLARAVILTLPREIDPVAGADLARDFFLEAFVRRGMVADIAVHNKVAKDGGPQPHAHALLTMRRIVDNAFGLKERTWNSVALLREWREEWADAANRKLAEYGVSAKLDHRRWFLWKAPKMHPQQEAETRHPIRDAARIAGALGIIGAAVTTQAMRDMARRFVGRERRADVPLDAGAPKAPMAPIDVLREELRQPLRAAAVGVAAGAWTYREALDRLVANHLVPATRRYPELEPRFEDLEERLGNALAKRAGRVQAQIDGNAALLRSRAAGRQAFTREGVMSDRVNDVAYIKQVSEQLGVPDAGRVDRMMQTPEFRAMEASIQKRIAASSTGEAGSLSVETSQSVRDRARQAVPARSATHSATEAARRAQVAAERAHVLTAG